MSDSDPTNPDARPEDDGGIASLSVETDRDLIREGSRSVRYLRVVIDASVAPADTTRPSLELALAVDRSGSMEGERLTLAKEAVATVLRMLSPADAFALVWFDDEVTPAVAPARPATSRAIAEAVEGLGAVQSGGSTALHAGWLEAARTIGTVSTERGGPIRRCLLITDGQANVGLQTAADLAPETRSMLGQRGVVTSCLGLGAGYNDGLLRAMADACDGQAYHVEHAAQLPTVLAREVGDALTIVSRAVELQVRPSEGVRVELVGRLASRWTGRHLAVSAGDLASGQRLELILRVTMPSAPSLLDPMPSVEVTAWSGGEPCVVPPARMEWRFADHHQNDRQPRRRDLDLAVATAHASLTREQAGDRVRHDRAGASSMLLATSKRIRSYAGDDNALNALADALESEARRVARGMDEDARKQYTMAAYSSSKGRSGDGSVRRRH